MATHVLDRAQALATEVIVDVETWNPGQGAGVRTRDLEDILKLFRAVLGVVVEATPRVLSAFCRPDGELSPESMKQITISLDRLSRKVHRVEMIIANIEQEEGITIPGSEELHALRLAIASHEVEAVRLCEQASVMAGFRPVVFDEEGRIFELDGTPYLFPGLEPENVRQGLADAAAGRYRPLADILAERRR
jgi:hypothetical protein